MRCNEILCVEMLERRAVARNLVRYRNQIMRRISESRRVEHLADVASRFGSLGVMVHESEAGHDVEQHDAAKNREYLARELRSERFVMVKNAALTNQTPETPILAHLDGWRPGMVAGYS